MNRATKRRKRDRRRARKREWRAFCFAAVDNTLTSENITLGTLRGWIADMPSFTDQSADQSGPMTKARILEALERM